MVYEFLFKADYTSPNASLKDNKVTFRNFKEGEVFVGTPLSKKVTANETIINKDNWMVPYSKLKIKSKNNWKDFEAYAKDKSILKAEELPPEILNKISDIANKNYAKKVGKAVSGNMKMAVLGLGAGLAYAFVAKKSVYVFGLGGLLVGLAIMALRTPKMEEPKNVDAKKQ